MNNKMNKTGKPKAPSWLSSFDALEFMVGNNIKSTWAEKGRGKKTCKFCIILHSKTTELLT